MSVDKLGSCALANSACCLCVYTFVSMADEWGACLVGSMSAGARLHVLRARYLRVDLDTVKALSATAHCSPLRLVLVSVL